MRNLLLGFVLGLLVATGAGVWAQSSQTLGQDLQNLKTSIIYCLNDNNGWVRDAKGYTTMQAKPQALKWCEDKALAVYKQRAESEERLIEGMTKSCCPYIKQAPAPAPRYQEPKGYRNVEAEKMLRQFEAGLQAAR